MTRWFCLLLAVGLLPVGCVSERERRMRKHRQMHQEIKSADGEPVGKWELKTKDAE